MMKTKLAVLAVGLLAMQVTDSAQGGGTAAGGAPSNAGTSLTTRGTGAFLSADMSFARGYVPVDPVRAEAARGGQINAGGMYSGGGVNPDLYRFADYDKLIARGHVGNFLSGDVRLTGGSLPWTPIRITVTCNGKASFTTTTDPTGSFRIAQNERYDATHVIGREKSFAQQFVGCTVTAALPGFQSSQLIIQNHDVQSGPNIGSIKLTAEEGSEGSAVSATTAGAPKDALKSFHKARDEWLSDKPDHAQRELQKALGIYPQFAEAWYQLGKLQAMAKSPEA